MPHFTCKIVKPDGSIKESSATGKDADAAKKQALKDHPGCEIRELKPKAMPAKSSVTAAPAKKAASQTTPPTPKQKKTEQVRPSVPPVSEGETKPKVAARSTTSILDRLFYLQHGKCFYCGDYITRSDSSLDHLLPKSKGGPNTDDNLVVCCKKINQVFGDMGLKEKLKFLTSDSGNVICPQKVIQTIKGAETGGVP